MPDRIITLPWVEEFRRIKEEALFNDDIVDNFSEYCDKKEKEYTEAWKK